MPQQTTNAWELGPFKCEYNPTTWTWDGRPRDVAVLYMWRAGNLMPYRTVELGNGEKREDAMAISAHIATEHYSAWLKEAATFKQENGL